MLSSGIDVNNISIRSAVDKIHGHDEDLRIANNISLKFGFKINIIKSFISKIDFSINQDMPLQEVVENILEEHLTVLLINL